MSSGAFWTTPYVFNQMKDHIKIHNQITFNQYSPCVCQTTNSENLGSKPTSIRQDVVSPPN